jgi:type IV pilus assembly protein PilO
MQQYLYEIARQKWRLLLVVLSLLLLNVIISIVVSVYQIPAVTELQSKWNALRRQSAGASKVDAAALYRQGTEDLEKLKLHIPEKREFARVLSDLYEAAASSVVEVGAISYKPTQIKEEPLLSYQLAFTVTGSYAAVKSYLADLQKNPELLVVDAVTFSNSDPFIENVTMDLRLTVYLREGA